LYLEPGGDGPKDKSQLLEHIPTTLSLEEIEELERAITEEDIYAAIQHMELNKALGLDVLCYKKWVL
jgi:hypothetical protein